jgi:hypothetical protein
VFLASFVLNPYSRSISGRADERYAEWLQQQAWMAAPRATMTMKDTMRGITPMRLVFSHA